MKAAVILLTVLLVLVLIGRIRIGGQARYSAAGAEAWIRLGGFRFQVYPSVKKEKKTKEKKRQTTVETRCCCFGLSYMSWRNGGQCSAGSTYNVPCRCYTG